MKGAVIRSVLDVAQTGNWIPNLINWLIGFVVVVVLDYFLKGVVWCYGKGLSGKSREDAVTAPGTPRTITPSFLLHFFSISEQTPRIGQVPAACQGAEARINHAALDCTF